MLSNASPFVLIYIGTVFYVLAGYMHLSFKRWTFKRALIVAMPLVLIEYIFTLNGNRRAHKFMGLSAQQILLTTMVFYFVNLWILNYLLLSHEVHLFNELIAFALIIGAFMISNVVFRR